MANFDPKVDKARERASKGDLAGALSDIDAALAEARQAELFRARLLEALRRPKAALDQLVALDRPNISAKELEFRASLEERLGQAEAAIATLTRSLPGLSDPTRLLVRRALLQQSIGAFEAAQDDLETALKRHPFDGELLRLHADLSKATKGDGRRTRIERALAQVPAAHPSAAHLTFALAKTLDDLGDNAAAGQAYLKANAQMRQHHPYDITDRLALVAALKSAFGQITPSAVQANAPSDVAPIFVTGLPRSGTSLLEQILASHAQVAAAGEVPYLTDAMAASTGLPESKTSGQIDTSATALGRMGHHYAEALSDRFADAPRVTDKSLQSVFLAGPALTAMPRAHMVVLRRNPDATAISLFRHVFRPGKQLFAYDLADIRAYQHSFEDMIDFWAGRLGARFHVLSYETLVTEPEQTIRALLDALDLPFDPACLAPETNPRAVQTLSAQAIRQPINEGALRAWERYASLLEDPNPV